jgi:hypothetical protein
MQQSAEANRNAAQRAAQARAAHEQRLAWQKAHPKEWAAQKAAARAALYKAAAERQAQRLSQQKRDEAQREYAAEHTPCKEFGRGIDSMDVGSVLSKYDCTEIGGGVLIHITVRDSAWSIADYDERLRLAKGLWAECVKYAHPEQADSCHVKLVGEGGEDLGGSNDFAGSMIDVSKD